MAGPRDQAARIVRSEPDLAEGGAGQAGSPLPTAEQLRARGADDPSARRIVDVPATEKPAPAVAPAATLNRLPPNPASAS